MLRRLKDGVANWEGEEIDPGEELYYLKKDPDQLNNLAANPENASVLTRLRARVDKVMKDTEDPRLKDAFDRLPWVDATKP